MTVITTTIQMNPVFCLSCKVNRARFYQANDHTAVFCSKSCQLDSIGNNASSSSSSPQVSAIMTKYANLATPEHNWETDKGTREYYAFRKKLVDALLEHVMRDIVKCPDKECTFKSVGSTTLFSDYDVSVLGPKSAEIVDVFNREFRLLFNGRESATVFDTNVYGGSWLDMNGKQIVAPQHVNARSQRVWAFIKVDLFVTSEERFKLSNLLSQAIAKRKKLDVGINRQNLTAMNKAYVKELYNVQHANAATMEEKMSRANYYGAETYFTQGAFLHVVGEIQMKRRDLTITLDQYMDSFVENIGECLKEIPATAKCERDTTDHMSKYFARAMDALIKARPTHPNREFLKKLYQSAERVRLEVRGHRLNSKCGKTDQTCVLPVRAKQLRAEFELLVGSRSCDALRSKVIEMLVLYCLT